ncbi:hypothetical protein F4780DRAFT_404933 [Xylariomycetidae sp. FL0641]|nr:hypothetical protein F4780DRAFT_404933 [Xylariomycetidae sp. FL0641]
MTVTMMIAYPKDANFDIEYYLQNHVPALVKAWKEGGMGAWRVTTAQDDKSPYATMFQCDWPDMETFNKTSAGTPEEVNQWFLEDMKKYTDKMPSIWFMDKKAGDS